jgi:SH3-like domain-containing protein
MILVIIILSLPCTAKAKMVAVAGDWINMRSGPGQFYPVLWQLDRGHPLKVLDKQRTWLHVVDFEGDKGWVAARLTSQTPHMIVRPKIVNIRSKPSTSATIIAKAQQGTVFRTLRHQGGWVKVRHHQGIAGWVAKHLLWGW